MSFYPEVLNKDPRFRSVAPVRDLDMLEPVTRAAVQAIIHGAAAKGITLIVTETYRSLERQQHLFSTGASKLKEVGVHHYGLAADFAKVIGGKASWDGDWTFLRDLAKENGLIWGGIGVLPRLRIASAIWTMCSAARSLFRTSCSAAPGTH